jgi:uncharacterized OB-fold protein
MCPGCHGLDLGFVRASGRGTVYSFVVAHHPAIPPFEYPNLIALVELDEQRGQPTPDEGLRIIANLVRADGRPEAEEQVAIGKRAQVTFHDLSADIALPQFTLIDEARQSASGGFPVKAQAWPSERPPCG